MRRIPWILLTLLVLSTSAAAAAVERPWTLTVGAANRFDNGRGDDLAGGLIAGGFDDQISNAWSRSHHPYSTHQHAATEVGLGLRYNERWGLHLSWRQGDWLDGEGVDMDPNLLIVPVYASAKTDLTSVSLQWEYWLLPYFQIAGGPSMHRYHIERESGTPKRPNGSQTGVCWGASLRGTLAYPPRSRVFGYLSGQWHAARKLKLRTFAGVPETEISTSHAVLSVGFGVRL